MLKLFENIVKLMGFKNLGVNRLFVVLLGGWFLSMLSLLMFEYYENEWRWMQIDKVLFIVFGFPAGFIISVRILKELYEGVITKIFKWIKDGFKKGYDV